MFAMPHLHGDSTTNNFVIGYLKYSMYFQNMNIICNIFQITCDKALTLYLKKTLLNFLMDFFFLKNNTSVE